MIEAHSRDWWRATLALCLGSFTVFVNLYAAQPLLPDLRHAFEVSTLASAMVMGVSTLTLAASLLIYGPLSDAIGRGAIMRITLLLAALCSLLLPLVPNFACLLALRALQGLVLGGLPAVAIAWMGDEFDRRALMLAVGLYISANTLGGIGGRVIGGFAGEYGGWHASFFTVGALSVACVAIFWRLLPAARNFHPTSLRLDVALGGIADHLRNPLLLGAYLIGGLNFFIFINQYSYITFRLSDAPYALSTQWLGMIFVTYLGGTLGSALSGRVAQRVAQPLCMLLGIVILMLGNLVTLSAALPGILLGLTVNAFGFFFCHSMASSWVSRQARAARGTASALYLVFYYLGASLGGLYLEPFWHAGGWPAVIAGSWLVLAVTLATAAWLWRRERRPLAATDGV
ncbi:MULTISPECIES: MFS transporter [unclassified Modicisalibacter]|uniref:MFS transporter n=1 Tax=unclassified Modicisalibacter TaxID=2679913 RepID=UPI001CCBC5E1|nr:MULTISPECIES: MFS transporter [unclassified Modicisalibacter]MBZ9560071.1 MFS transporter [Modicisalibacter sp. R2A 31.J]MBZ9575980.1 MFS transporter [Modicisalibacter sp. MOD 31.J]